ncbi:hypothetical protein QTP70_023611 [Hemibagrus guttatus]|uniref:Myoneurin n=1 Tax=Hemibagrus guttatus TaxID=175788 RepID=A0AAE0Q763_9TELE|nr:hypothetical protein QTP70_023611 [Hemibagrus guttatus]
MQKMQFVEEFDSLYTPEEPQDEDSYEDLDKAKLLHSNSCLRTLYTDLQKVVEMTEDSNMLLRTENNDLKNQIRSMKQSIQNVQPLVNELEDIRAAKTEKDQICDAIEASLKELVKENETLRQQIETLTSETSSFILKREQQEKELTNLSCVLRALQQQLEENRLHLEQKDELINQRDFVIEQLKDSVSEYININQDMKEKLKDLEEQLALALVSGEGSFMKVDMTLALAPEQAISLREELGILSEDQMNPVEEQKEEEENAETLEEQAALYVSKRSVVFHTMARVPHGEFLLEQLRKQRERGFLCDCTVVIGQARYEAHRNVLAAFSEYFSTQCIDAGREDSTITLDPEWVNSAMFKKLLDYMYTGNLDMDGDEIPNVQNAASYLGIQEVLALCSSTADTESSVPVTDTLFTDPRSPLSPDDYEPLEPLEEVEEREMLRKEEEKKSGMFQEKAAPADDSQLSSEQTPQGSEKRIRKPRTRLYEEDDDFTRKESPLSPRGRGRGRGRPRGRPRTRPLDSDKADTVVMDNSPVTETAVARRGTGRPRGRPRTRPLSSEAVDSASAEENSTVVNNEEMDTGTEQSEPSKSVNPQGDAEEVNVNNEEVENKTPSDAENPKESVVTKRGRGRPRTKSLPSEATDIQNPEETFSQILQKEGGVRKRGRPRSKPPPSEMPESDNTEGGTEQDEGPDQENNQPKASSSEPLDDKRELPENSKKLRTSTRKRSLSRKLRESQASNDENEQDEAAEEEGSEEWEDEKDDKVLQNKLRPICNICGNLFSEMSSLRRHMRIHKGLKPYQCQLCGRCFRQGNQLKTHLRIHTGEKPFSCSCCDASFAQKCQLVYHCRMHHGEEKPHKCDVCPAAFATSSNLKIHMRTHSGEKPYECGECGKRFTQASTLMYHKRRHTGEKPYVCDTCGMAFAVSSSLISHTRKHTGVTPYICLDCGKPCLTSGELRKHMDIHNGSRRVICNICGSTLSDIYSLKKHQALKHKAPLEQDNEPKKSESVECPINIPIDHQGLIARVRSVLSESPEPSFPDESPLTSEASMIIHQPETPMIIKHSEAAEAPMIIQHADGSGTQMISGSPMIIQHAESSEAPMIIQHTEAGGTPMIIQHSEAGGTPMIIQHSEAGGTPMIIQHSEAGGTPMIIQHSEGSETPLIIQHADSSGAQMISGSPMIIQHGDSSETPMIIQHSEATGSPMIIQHDESSETPVLIQHGDSGEQLARRSPVAMGTRNNQSGAFYLSDFRSITDMESLNGLYSSICSDLQLSPNKYISQELKETEHCIRDVSLTLRGHNRPEEESRLTDEDVRALSKTLRDHLHLKALDLSYNRISDKGAAHLADLIQENVALQELDLMCNHITAEGAERIAKSLHHNITLKRLRLTGNKMGREGAMHFASMLQINSTLEELDVSDCDLDTQSLITFAIVLTINRSLISVNVSRPLLFSLQEETTVHTARMLEVNHSLKELHMGKHGMTDWGLQRLCEALISNHSLCYLDLRCNRITRDGARQLAGLLKQNDTLKILDLSFNRIEDDGVVCLSDAIMLKHTKLRALSIQSNNVSTVGLLSLSKAINTNPHLTHIYIWGNRLEEPACVAFSQLISSGRLSEQHTDVTPYTVDGRVHLAEVSNGLRKHYYWTLSYSEDGDAASNATLTLNTSHHSLTELNNP